VRDRCDRVVACAVFGAAAWKTEPRDSFIGWDPATRAMRLGDIANNNRYLILPWVEVPHLASHVLGLLARRIRNDWMEKYCHPVALLETFVDRGRFRGTCYRAANWQCVGQTQGRSRQDRHKTMSVPIKDIYLYPLTPEFRKELTR
ncbi:MAG: Druantia anti-phage system protein DruA, partial [Rectinemataceae bacterium]